LGIKRSPSFSADGNQVAFSWTGPEQNNTDVYVQQIGAGSPLRLTSDPADDYSPLWSPDGRSIAFLRRQTDRTELRLIPPLGGPERKLADLHPVGAFLRAITLAWCPDSSCVVVTDSPGVSKRDALFAVSVESGEKRQLTDPQVAIESIDGADLYYVDSATDRPGPLLRQPVKGGAPVKVVDDVSPLAFDVVEKGIYYIERVGSEWRLRYVDVASGTSTLIARNLGTVFTGLTASRDGRVILFTRIDSSVDDLMLVENFR
jgi:dipeptidyl aminopeptidase/acylaminoacyl peptidase